MTHYDTLGISKNASQKEIKEAYKKLVKKYHPDIYKGDKSFAEKKTQEINSAYDVLSNEELKKAYDEEINPPVEYNYTPPKYSNPESYRYQNYYRNNDSDFESYKRYADYHRSKVPNSNYTYKNNLYDQFSDNLFKSVNKLSAKNILILMGIILCIYLIFLAINFWQLSYFMKDENSASLNTTKSSPYSNTTHNNQSNSEYTNSNSSKYKNDFDINEYIPEDSLREIYAEYYFDVYDSYDEFRETLSEYLYYRYNN